MKTADWAFVFSLFSLTISLASFIWNVWSKFIFPKASVRVGFSVMKVHTRSGTSAPYLNLHVTNYGPGDVTIYAAIAKGREYIPRFLRRMVGRKSRIGVLNPLSDFPGDMDHSSDGPFSGGLPHKLAVGESFDSRFPYNHAGLIEGQIIDVGFCDTFGRNHWAPRRQVREVLSKIRAAAKTVAPVTS